MLSLDGTALASSPCCPPSPPETFESESDLHVVSSRSLRSFVIFPLNLPGATPLTRPRAAGAAGAHHSRRGRKQKKMVESAPAPALVEVCGEPLLLLGWERPALVPPGQSHALPRDLVEANGARDGQIQRLRHGMQSRQRDTRRNAAPDNAVRGHHCIPARAQRRRSSTPRSRIAGRQRHCHIRRGFPGSFPSSE